MMTSERMERLRERYSPSGNPTPCPVCGGERIRDATEWFCKYLYERREQCLKKGGPWTREDEGHWSASYKSLSLKSDPDVIALLDAHAAMEQRLREWEDAVTCDRVEAPDVPGEWRFKLGTQPASIVEFRHDEGGGLIDDEGDCPNDYHRDIRWSRRPLPIPGPSERREA